MLSKTKRVKKVLFTKVFSSGKVVYSIYLTARVVLPTGAVSGRKEPSRFSFVVSKAVAKKAVDRNLLRRRGYAVISKLYDSLPGGLVVVFFYKKGADKLPYTALSVEIKNLLDKAGLFGK